MESKNLVAIKIKEARNEIGYSSEEVAKTLNIAKGTYSNWENGKCEMTISKLELLGHVLKKPISYFLQLPTNIVQINHGENGNNIKAKNYCNNEPEVSKLVNESIKILNELLIKLKA